MCQTNKLSNVSISILLYIRFLCNRIFWPNRIFHLAKESALNKLIILPSILNHFSSLKKMVKKKFKNQVWFGKFVTCMHYAFSNTLLSILEEQTEIFLLLRGAKFMIHNLGKVFIWLNSTYLLKHQWERSWIDFNIHNQRFSEDVKAYSSPIRKLY